MSTIIIQEETCVFIKILMDPEPENKEKEQRQRTELKEEKKEKKIIVLAKILGLMRSDGIEIQRCYLDYLEALVSHYKGARSSRNPTGGYKGIRRFEDYRGDGNMDGSLAAKEKGRVEHFGITLKEEEEGKHKLMHTTYCQ
ncbi:hypothetical protein Tco_1371862 [Tanacetum coccineum]